MRNFVLLQTYFHSHFLEIVYFENDWLVLAYRNSGNDLAIPKNLNRHSMYRNGGI